MISIITDWGNTLGTGHMQRMAALAEFIRHEKNLPCSIESDRMPDFLPSSAHRLFRAPTENPGCMIIHDRRDSTVEEILSLKLRGRVVTVDDCGDGRTVADACIDLLPNLTYKQQEKNSFIYGYNFIESLRAAGRIEINKNIDVAIYAGFNPASETILALRSLVPEQAVCAILTGNNQVLSQGNIERPLNLPYSEILSASKVFISHFGIALYEAHLAQCRLISVNPTEYHARLADSVRNDLGVLNMGTLNSVDRRQAREMLSQCILNPLAEKVNPEIMLDKTRAGLEHFYSLLLTIMNGCPDRDVI